METVFVNRLSRISWKNTFTHIISFSTT